MTRVDFYHDADDKLAVLARLAQKGIAAGKRILISAPDPEAVNHIDRWLWTFAPQSFLPHASLSSPQAAESPIVIVQKNQLNAASSFDVVINLDQNAPDDLQNLRRIIEIVTHDEDDKSAARDRYKHYRASGCELVAHRLGNNE